MLQWRGIDTDGELAMRSALTWSTTLIAILAMSTDTAWGFRGHGGYGPGMMWGGGWGGSIFGMLMMFLYFAAIVVVVMFVIRWVGGLGSKHQPPSESSALQILKERFARGEIDEAEFERRKHHLSD